MSFDRHLHAPHRPPSLTSLREHLVPHPTLETYRSRGDVNSNVLRLRERGRGGRRPRVRLGRHDSLCGTEMTPHGQTRGQTKEERPREDRNEHEYERYKEVQRKKRNVLHMHICTWLVHSLVFCNFITRWAFSCVVERKM